MGDADLDAVDMPVPAVALTDPAGAAGPARAAVSSWPRRTARRSAASCRYSLTRTPPPAAPRATSCWPARPRRQPAGPSGACAGAGRRTPRCRRAGGPGAGRSRATSSSALAPAIVDGLAQLRDEAVVRPQGHAAGRSPRVGPRSGVLLRDRGHDDEDAVRRQHAPVAARRPRCPTSTPSTKIMPAWTRSPKRARTSRSSAATVLAAEDRLRRPRRPPGQLAVPAAGAVVAVRASRTGFVRFSISFSSSA